MTFPSYLSLIRIGFTYGANETNNYDEHGRNLKEMENTQAQPHTHTHNYH